MKRAFSAGGVVYKLEGDILKILLISTQKGRVWSLPKGIIEKDEKPEEAALREIKEETGVDSKIIDEIGEVSYWFALNNEKYFKTVKYFLAEYTGGEISPDSEVDFVQWFNPKEALEKLTYKSDREILKKALERLNG